MIKKSLLLLAISTGVLSTPVLSKNAKMALGSDNESSTFLKGYELKSLLLNNVSISDAEKAYLSSDSFIFNYDLPTCLEYNAAKLGDNYYVELFFNDQNGYVPTKVMSGEKSFNDIRHINNQYIVAIPTNEVSSLEGSKIVLEKKVNVSKEVANKVINAAYNAKTNELEVRDLISKYNAWTSYEEYLVAKKAYDIAYDKYEAYLIAMNSYNEENARYLEYLSSLEHYSELVEKYNQYVKDLNYYNLNKDKNAKEYQEYLNNIAPINKHLNTMKIMTTNYGSLNTSLSTFIKGGTVTSVLSKKEDLVNILGVSSTSVDMSSEATKNIRLILDEYAALTSDADRYAYYQTNYKNRIRPYFTKLTQCLESFLINENVKNTLISEGKLEKYVLLVAELMYITDELNDSEVMSFAATYNGVKSGSAYYKLDSSRSINGKNYTSILNVEPADNSISAVPTNSVYPEEPVELLIEPTPVTNPGDIVPVAKPTKPAEVSSPGEEPTLVSKPNFTKPENISPIDETLNDLVSDNSIVKVKDFTEDQVITVSKSLEITKLSKVAVFNDVDASNADRLFGDDYKFTFYEENNVPSLEGYINELNITEDEKAINFTIFEEVAKLQSFNVKWFVEGEDTPYLENTCYLHDVPTPSILPTKEGELINGIHYIYEVSNYVMDAGNGQEELRTLNVDDSSFDIVVIAKLIKVRTYSVRFENNGELLNEQYLKKGSFVSAYPHEATREENYSYKYEFEGWKVNGELVDVGNYEITRDTRFIASYKLIRKYYVTFVTNDETVTNVYYEGELPDSQVVEAKDKHDDNFYYEFDGFDKEITPVSGEEDVTYTAKYKEGVRIISNATIIKNNESYSIAVNKGETSINVSKFMEIMEQDNLVPNMVIEFDNATIKLGKSHVSFLMESNISTIGVTLSQTKDSFMLIAINKNNEVITNSQLKPVVTLKNLKNINKIHTFLGDEESDSIISRNENELQISLHFNETISLVEIFTLTFDQFSQHKITVNNKSIMPGEALNAKEGDVISVSCVDDTNAYLYAINYATGEQIEIDEEFVMPRGDVKIFACSKNVVFDLILKVDGAIYKTFVVNAGSKISLPTNVNKSGNGGVTYSFDGWVKEGTSEKVSPNYIVTENAVLEATFKENVVVDDEVSDSKSYSKVIGIASVGVVVAAFIGISCAVCLRKKAS